MNTDKPTILIPHNQPVSMPRTPQLGDTHVIHATEPPRRADAPDLDAEIAKGLSPAETAVESEALLGILGGSSTATSPPPENFLQTLTDNETSLQLEMATAWLNPAGLPCWVVISPDPVTDGASTILDHYTTYVGAHEQLQENLTARILVPGFDDELLPGYTRAYAPAEVTMHVANAVLPAITDPSMDMQKDPDTDAPSDTTPGAAPADGPGDMGEEPQA